MAGGCLLASFLTLAATPGTTKPDLTGRPVLAELAACRGTRLPAGRAEEPSTSLSLASPSAGRLNGENFSLLVLGYAHSPCVPGLAGEPGLVAPPHEDVAAVSLLLESFGAGALPQLAIRVNGNVAWHTNASLGASTIALAVPAGAAVALSASEDGVTQSLSLVTGKRTGEVPEALYRAAIGPAVVKSPLVTERLGVSSGQATGRQSLTLAEYSLGYFSPSDRPAGPGRGDVAVELLLGRSFGGVPDWLRWLPSSRVHLEVTAPPGERETVRARAFFNELGGSFSFEVPAGILRATLVVTPGSLDVGGVPVRVTGTARFALSFPAPPRWLAASGRTRQGGALSSAPGSRHARGAGGDVKASSVATAVVVIAAAGGSSLVVIPILLVIPWRRRRQRKKGPYALSATGAAVVPTAPPSEPEVSTAGAPIGGVAATAPEVPDPVFPPGPGFLALGAVGAVGLELPTKRFVVVELLGFLALKRERLTAGEIIDELWPLADDGSETVNIHTFRSYVSAARKAAGPAAVPKAEGNTYRIGDGIWTDWGLFCELTGRAGQADATDARRLLGEALALVRGRVFSGVPDGRYTWAFSSGLASEMELAIKAAAGRLADLSLEGDCPAEALGGLRRALVATRDDEVADDLITVSGATGSLAELERAWRDVVASGADVARLEKNYQAIKRRLVHPGPEA